MTERIALDTGPLGMATHPRTNRSAAEWLRSMLESDVEVLIPEIADYELRRQYILKGFKESIERLDQLITVLGYCPIDTATMRRAAQFWADSRSRHTPTGHPKELDGDAILAAQAKQAGATVVTDNVGHLSQFVKTKKWSEMGFGYDD